MGMLSSIASKVASGELFTKTSLKDSEIKIYHDKVLTSKAIKKVWCLSKIGYYTNDVIIPEIVDTMNEKFPDVKTKINIRTTPSDIKVTKKFLNQLKTTYQLYKKNKELFNERVTESDKEVSSGAKVKNENGVWVNISEDIVEEYRIKYESFKYMRDIIKSGGVMTYTFIFVEAVFNNKEEISDYTNLLMTLGSTDKRETIEFKEVSNGLEDYIRTYTPFVAPKKYTKVNDVNGLILSTENISDISICASHGYIGSGDIYGGTVVANRSPNMLSFTDSQTAQVILLCAKSGNGKTATAMSLVFSHKSAGHHISIEDYKGNEYSALNNFDDCTEIAFSGSNPMYANTIKLITHKDLNESMTKELAFKTIDKTIQIITLLADLRNEEMERDFSGVVSDMLKLYYRSNMVDINDTKTYTRSRSLSYFGLYELMMNSSSGASNRVDVMQAYQKGLDNLKRYFTEDGNKSFMFKNEIDLDTIIDSQIIIFNFNKNTSDDASGHDIDDLLRFSFKSFIDNVKTMVLKSKRKYFVLFYEELQRGVRSPKRMSQVNTDVTGGRSDNKIVYLISNSINFLEDDKDPNITAIRSNITTYMIGRLNPRDIKYFKEKIDYPDLAILIEMIQQKPTKYAFCFAIGFDNGNRITNSICKMEIPKELLESDLFRSRDVS